MEAKRYSPTDHAPCFASVASLASGSFNNEGVQDVKHGLKYTRGLVDGGVQTRQKTMLHLENREALALSEQRMHPSSPLACHREVCYSPTFSHRIKDPPSNDVNTTRSNSMPVSPPVVATAEQRMPPPPPSLAGAHTEVYYSSASRRGVHDSPQKIVSNMRSNIFPALPGPSSTGHLIPDASTVDSRRWSATAGRLLMMGEASVRTESFPKTRITAPTGDRYWFVRSASTCEVPHTGIMEMVFFDTVEVPTSTLNADKTSGLLASSSCLSSTAE
jgi:hypothetical protein